MKPFILALFALIVACGSSQTQQENILPEEIATMTRTHAIMGADADTIITRLHRKVVTDQKNFIGQYSNGNHKATLYVTRYTEKDSALKDFQRMAERINNPKIGGSMGYKHIRNVPELGNHAYMTLEGERVHYYFVQESKLYWLEVDPEMAMNAVKQFGTADLQQQ